MLSVYYFTINSKGISALNLSRHIGVQYKTSWALLHKFREAVEKTQDYTPLTGIIHIDGCYVNNYLRPKILNISELIDVRDVTNVKINPALWFSVNKLQIRK